MVYAFLGTEGVYDYDYNGKLAWKVNLGNLGTVPRSDGLLVQVLNDAGNFNNADTTPIARCFWDSNSSSPSMHDRFQPCATQFEKNDRP